ncbi:transglutaminase domain-containing protein [Alicyclobacillus fodiniaquatilis]|uniref:Transglutaminase domain-containing protein n=1 Tax=Alicyclobacillus fodiniaquatilis TaxID=1661150 RepID=A0ABW4JNF2_9BACL
MKKSLIATSLVALSTLVGLTGCATQAPATPTQAQPSTAQITSTDHRVSITAQTGTRDSGIAQVTMLGPDSEYQYAVPVTDGNVQTTLTVPWSGKTNIAVSDGSKTVTDIDATVSGSALSEQQLDLLPSYTIDSNIPSVAAKAHAIASSVTTQGTDRNQAIASAIVQWVKQHIHTTNPTQTARADETLTSGNGNQASRTALAVALLRADNIPAKVAQEQVASNGMYGTAYSVQSWLNGKWLNLGTP